MNTVSATFAFFDIFQVVMFRKSRLTKKSRLRRAAYRIVLRYIATFQRVLHLRGRRVVAFYFHAFGWRSVQLHNGHAHTRV